MDGELRSQDGYVNALLNLPYPPSGTRFEQHQTALLRTHNKRHLELQLHKGGVFRCPALRVCQAVVVGSVQSLCQYGLGFRL